MIIINRNGRLRDPENAAYASYAINIHESAGFAILQISFLYFFNESKLKRLLIECGVDVVKRFVPKALRVGSGPGNGGKNFPPRTRLDHVVSQQQHIINGLSLRITREDAEATVIAFAGPSFR